MVAELSRRGHAVEYWSFDEFRPAIEGAGGRFRAYPDVPGYRDRQAADNLLRLARLVMEVTERIIPSILGALRADPPDVVVYDALAVWGAYAARVLGIPGVTSFSTFVVDGRVLRRDAALLLYGLRQIAGAWPELLPFERSRRALRRRYGTPAPRADEMWSIRERLNLVFTSRELQPFGELFQSDYTFVGPALRSESLSDFPFEALRAPLIYVSLGTLFNDRPEFFRAAIDAFGTDGGSLVLAVGDAVDPADLGPVPPHVVVRRFVPQLALLRRAALFVTHGGMNSVNEALSFGVPLLVYPQVHDQLVVARRVVELGAGLRLRGRPDAAALRRAADDVLGDPRYRQRSQVIGATLRASGGAARAADEIERFAASRLRGEDEPADRGGESQRHPGEPVDGDEPRELRPDDERPEEHDRTAREEERAAGRR